MKNTLLLVILGSLLYLNSFAQSTLQWIDPSEINSDNSFDNLHPRVAVNRAGEPMVIWGRSSDKSVFFSKWTGTDFSAPVKLNPSWMSVATASWMGPQIAAHGDTVYVVVKRVPEDLDTNHIFLFRSFDGGNNFASPIQIDVLTDSISRFPTVTTDDMGNPVVAFMKFNMNFSESYWMLMKSDDFGSSFSQPILASDWNNEGEVCDCCPGAVVSEGANLAVLYRSNDNNIRDIWAGISTNSGATFENGYNVDENNWMVMSCPASGPDAVIVDDTLYSVFLSSASGSYRNYLSKFSLGSNQLIDVKNLGDNITNLTQQNYPRIENNGKAVAIVWRQIVGSTTILPILFTQDITAGFPQFYDTVDLGYVTNADVTVSGSDVFVVWQDDNSGTVRYRRGIYNSLANVYDFTNEWDVKMYPNPVNKELLLTLPKEVFQIEITDILGKSIDIFHPGSETKTSFGIDMSTYKAGVYFVSLSADGKTFSYKIIKN